MSSPNGEPGWSSVEHAFEVDHPTAAGHFPGNPIIPGAVLLEQAMRAIAVTQSDASPPEIRHAKFLCPVRPGDRITIRWRRLDDGEVQFEMRQDGSDQCVLVGTMRARCR